LINREHLKLDWGLRSVESVRAEEEDPGENEEEKAEGRLDPEGHLPADA
jgi:hypothetical protein